MYFEAGKTGNTLEDFGKVINESKIERTPFEIMKELEEVCFEL